ncbi:MAG: hypothetical protein AAB922_03175 [Patescibacteria group bacterium]
MDDKTEHILHQIAESVYEDPMKLVKDEFHENQIQQAHDILKHAKSSSRQWDQRETERAERAANMVLKRLDGTHREVDPHKAQELDKRLEVRIQQAFRDGRIKPADAREYQAYMDKIKKK